MTAPRSERLTDADLDGIARFGVAIERDQQAMAAELLELRQVARALVDIYRGRRERAGASFPDAVTRLERVLGAQEADRV